MLAVSIASTQAQVDLVHCAVSAACPCSTAQQNGLELCTSGAALLLPRIQWHSRCFDQRHAIRNDQQQGADSEPQQRPPTYFTQSDAIDDGGVVELITDDGVLSRQQRLKQTRVGVETAGVQNRVLGAAAVYDALVS